MAFRSALVQERGGTRLAVTDSTAPAAATTAPPRAYPVFVYWRQAPTRSDGEIRGEFWDLGRLREDDCRFTAYDFKPMLEAVNGGHWPNRDELFVVLGASLIEADRLQHPHNPQHRADAGALRRPRRDRLRAASAAAISSAISRMR